MTNSLRAVFLLCAIRMCGPGAVSGPAGSGSLVPRSQPTMATVLNLATDLAGTGPESLLLDLTIAASLANTNTAQTASQLSLAEEISAQMCNFLNPKDICALYGADKQKQKDIQVLIDTCTKNARTMDEFLHWASLANLDLGKPVNKITLDLGKPVNKITLCALIKKLGEFIPAKTLAGDKSPFSKDDLSQVASLLIHRRSTPGELLALSENNHLNTLVTLFTRRCSGQDASDALKQLQPAVDSFIQRSDENTSRELWDLTLLIAKLIRSLEGTEAIHNEKKPLHIATKYGYTEFVKLLLEKGLNVNMKDQHRRTPLHLAAAAGNTEIVTLLLAHNGVDVDATDDCSRTPLHNAAIYGHTEVVQLLLKKKAQVNARDHCDRTPLWIAAEKGCVEITQLLLKNEAQVDAVDNIGRTCLHISCINLLLKNEAQVDAVNNIGRACLHISCINGYAAVVRLLLERKASVNTTDQLKRTPLHCAAARGHEEVVKFLLANNADITAQNRDGQTPEILARDKGHADVADLFAEHARRLAQQQTH